MAGPAGRLVHAITVQKPGGTYWNAYVKASRHNLCKPFNMLLTFYYIRQLEKSPQKQADLLQEYLGISNGGIIVVDSGIYTFKAKRGLTVQIGQGIDAGLEKARAAGETLLPEITRYVEEYAQFLSASQGLWTFAIDFDAEQFLYEDTVDRLHEKLVESSGLPRDRIARVYHSARVNVENWWRTLCEDSRYGYVAVEGGNSHGKDPVFYNHLATLAHQYNKKIHTFAITGKDFPARVFVDTFDASTHLSGGRFGYVMTPWGAVSLGTNIDRGNHYKYLDCSTQDVLKEYWGKRNWFIEDLDKYYNRATENIWAMNELWDVPYVESSHTSDIFELVEEL